MLTSLALAFAFALPAAEVRAQSRTLYWDDLDVECVLDGDGRLHVTETQTMVFDGPWNGGERSFRVAPYQKLEFISLTELDPERNVRRNFLPGPLDAVGEYRWFDGYVLRWRNRAVDDPPFAATRRTYELRYTLSNVLKPHGDVYVLDHDFAFPNRPGVIRKFSARLKLAAVWEPVSSFEPRIVLNDLTPGRGAVRRFELRHHGTSQPAAVLSGAAALRSYPAEKGVGAALLLALLGWFAWLYIRFIIPERRSGHLAPLPELAEIDRAYLDRCIFVHPPEVVGAAWDRRTTEHEVAAIIAKLVLENKLRTEVVTSPVRKVPSLRLHLLCDRDALAPHERTLVDGLFFAGDTTSTRAIRRHYKSSGFDPAALIAPELEALVAQRCEKPRPLPRWRGRLTFGLIVLSGLLLFYASGPLVDTIPWVVGAVIGVLLLFAFARYQAAQYRNTVADMRPRFVRTRRGLALLLAFCAVALTVLEVGLSALQLAAIALLVAALLWSIYNGIAPRETAESYRFRKGLAAGRAYFIAQLNSPKPDLLDAWVPYLLAFGLGSHMDHWFEAFGGRSDDSDWSRSSTASSGLTGASSSQSGGFRGGGGAFGGAGATGSWTAAVGAMAAGVSPPSSSSSSSGGGGGGSSGGGGGGGW